MRIDIKCKSKDKEIRGIYVLAYAFDKLIPKEAHRRVLEYFISRSGLTIRQSGNDL